MKNTGILGFVSDISLEARKLKRFKRIVARSSSNIKKRQAERGLLKPAPLPIYTGNLPSINAEMLKKSIKFIFRTDKEFALFKKYFYVGTYVDQNVTQMDLVMDLLEKTEKGKFVLEKGKVFCAKCKLKKLKRIKSG